MSRTFLRTSVPGFPIQVNRPGFLDYRPIAIVNDASYKLKSDIDDAEAAVGPIGKPEILANERLVMWLDNHFQFLPA